MSPRYAEGTRHSRDPIAPVGHRSESEELVTPALVDVESQSQALNTGCTCEF